MMSWMITIIDVMMYTKSRGNQETKKFCSGKAMNLGCLQPPRKQEVPSRPMLLGVTASPESSTDGNHLGTLQDPTGGYLPLYVYIYYIHIYIYYIIIHIYIYIMYIYIHIDCSEDFAIHSICGDIKMSAEFIVMVKRRTRHTKLIRIGDDHLTEVEFLPPLPLKDDELESSEYWIAAPWYYLVPDRFPIFLN